MTAAQPAPQPAAVPAIKHAPLRYRRLLLKLSGEALMGEAGYGIDMNVVNRIAAEVRQAVDAGAQIALVVGGGNIFRGLAGAAQGMDRANADYMGMLATVMNSLAMHNALERAGVPARVMSAIPMPSVCETFIRPKALHHFRCRHRQSVLHDRYDGGSARCGGRVSRHGQGDTGRRCLFGRPQVG
jgi:hypothetical protein